MDERRPGPQWPSMCYRGLEVKGHWQNIHPLSEPHFVSIGAKVGPKAVTVRRKMLHILEGVSEDSICLGLEFHEDSLWSYVYIGGTLISIF